MPFRLLGFSCWDDRSGRFFLNAAHLAWIWGVTVELVSAKWELGLGRKSARGSS